MISGARMNYGYFRIGGLSYDLPDGFEEKLREFIAKYPKMLQQYADLFAKNDIFLARTKGVGVISQETAIDLAVTGPNLRSTGVALDYRKLVPYSGYEDYDFDVPTATDGDVYSRFMVRFAEMGESLKIVEQALDRLEPGPIKDPNRHISLPPRSELAHSMEALIFHFKLVTEGFSPAKKESYVVTESARGELSYYIVSDGGSRPYRVKVRTPSLMNIQVLESACKGGLFADLVMTLASLDPILGDIDK